MTAPSIVVEELVQDATIESPTATRKLIPREAVVQAVEAERKTFAPDEASKPNHLTPADTGLGWLEGYVRTTMEQVLDELLVARIVASIVAEGGTGKTYLLMRLFASIATGIPYGPLRPTKPRKVLLLLGEDPDEIIKLRMFDILAAESFPKDLLRENLHVASVRGQCGPLLKFDGKGNVILSKWSDWLNETIVAHRPEVLGLDPLRKFYGLEENANEHAHAFIGLLEKISEEHRLLPMFAHHVSKMDRGIEASKITGRGAGGFSDNCRWVAAMRTVTQEQADSLELDGPYHQFVEFVVTKNSYAGHLPAPIFFKRDSNGVLHHTNVAADRLNRHAEYLAHLLASSGDELTQRGIWKDPAGKNIRSGMEKEFKGTWHQREFPYVIEYGVERGILHTEARRKGTGPEFLIVLPGEES